MEGQSLVTIAEVQNVRSINLSLLVSPRRSEDESPEGTDCVC